MGPMVTGEGSTAASLEGRRGWIIDNDRGSPRTQHLQDCNYDSKEANGTAKDLHDENLHKEAGVLCISQGGSTAHDAHANSTEKVG